LSIAPGRAFHRNQELISMTDVTPAEFVSSGPQYPGEDVHTAMAENTVQHLAGHLLRRAQQPGLTFEDEPTNTAEKQSKQTAQHALQDFDFDGTAKAIRAAVRPSF
jgi:hypothetical protein